MSQPVHFALWKRNTLMDNKKLKPLPGLYLLSTRPAAVFFFIHPFYGPLGKCGPDKHVELPNPANTCVHSMENGRSMNASCHSTSLVDDNFISKQFHKTSWYCRAVAALRLFSALRLRLRFTSDYSRDSIHIELHALTQR